MAAATDNTAYIMQERREVRCSCNRVLFDRLVVRARVVRVNPDGSTEGKCRCKRWVRLPLQYCDA